jgi:hypothetical protein
MQSLPSSAKEAVHCPMGARIERLEAERSAAFPPPSALVMSIKQGEQ